MGYKIVYADPAWVYQDKSKSHGGGAESHYKCTPTEEMGKIIQNIDVDKDAVCLMWCTYPQLEEGLKLMNLWGFKFKTVAFTWVKKNKKSDSFFFGMGRHTRGNPEIVLLGTKGKGVKRINAGIPNLQIHKIAEHSRKPNEIRKKIVELYGDIPRIELFAREKLEGFDVWGDETSKFNKPKVEGSPRLEEQQEEETIFSGALAGQPHKHKIKLAPEPSDFEGKTTAIECSGELFDKKELLELVEEVYKSRPNAGAEWMDFANEMEKRLKC